MFAELQSRKGYSCGLYNIILNVSSYIRTGHSKTAEIQLVLIFLWCLVSLLLIDSQGTKGLIIYFLFFIFFWLQSPSSSSHSSKRPLSKSRGVQQTLPKRDLATKYFREHLFSLPASITGSDSALSTKQNSGNSQEKITLKAKKTLIR